MAGELRVGDRESRAGVRAEPETVFGRNNPCFTPSREGLECELLGSEGIAVQHACFVCVHLLEYAAQCGGERRPGLGPRRIERDSQEVREVLVLQLSITRVAFRCLHEEAGSPPRLPRLGFDQHAMRPPRVH